MLFFFGVFFFFGMAFSYGTVSFHIPGGIRKTYVFQYNIPPARRFPLLSGAFLHRQKVQVVADGTRILGHLRHMPAYYLLHDAVQHAKGIKDRRKRAHRHFLLHQGIIQHPENAAVPCHRQDAHGKLKQVRLHSGLKSQLLQTDQGLLIQLFEIKETAQEPGFLEIFPPHHASLIILVFSAHRSRIILQMSENLHPEQLRQSRGQEYDNDGAGQNRFQRKQIPPHKGEIWNIKGQNCDHIINIPKGTVLPLFRLIDVIQLLRIFKDNRVQTGNFLMNQPGKMCARLSFHHPGQEIGCAVQHLTCHICNAQKRQCEKGLQNSRLPACRIHRLVEKSLLHHGFHAEGDAVENGKQYVCSKQNRRCFHHHRQKLSQSARGTSLSFFLSLLFH